MGMGDGFGILRAFLKFSTTCRKCLRPKKSYMWKGRRTLKLPANFLLSLPPAVRARAGERNLRHNSVAARFRSSSMRTMLGANTGVRLQQILYAMPPQYDLWNFPAPKTCRIGWSKAAPEKTSLS